MTALHSPTSIHATSDAAKVFGHLMDRPTCCTAAAHRFSQWLTQAWYEGTVTYDVIGRALVELAPAAGWYLDQPARLYAPTSNYGPGHTGTKYTYARACPNGDTEYLAIAGLDDQTAEIHLNGEPLTWAELCGLMARDLRPLYREPLVNLDWLGMLADRAAELDAQAALDERMAAQGKQRVACQWCDDEFYAPITESGPMSCRRCATACDGL
jgi:hypothetical protein